MLYKDKGEQHKVQVTQSDQRIEMLDIGQAADYLKLKPSYLYKLTHYGKIAHYKPGGKKIYFNISDLNQWLFSCRVLSNKELDSLAASHIAERRMN